MILAFDGNSIVHWGAVSAGALSIMALVTFAGGRWVVRSIIAGVEANREDETRRVVKEELRPLEERTLELTSNGGTTLKDHVKDMRWRLDGVAEHLRVIEERQLSDRALTDSKMTEVWRELAHVGIDRRTDLPRRDIDKENL